MSQSGRAAWSVITALAVAATVWSLSAGATISGNGCCIYQDNGTSCTETNEVDCGQNFNGTFTAEMMCDGDDACREPLLGCCGIGKGFCRTGLDDELDCLDGDFVEGQTCVPDEGDQATTSGPPDFGRCEVNTPTATATATATPTATGTVTETRLPEGDECFDPADCESGNCVDDVCCDSACDGPNEECNLPGLEGNCLATSATVPAASNTGLLLALAAMSAVALFAIARRRRA